MWKHNLRKTVIPLKWTDDASWPARSQPNHDSNVMSNYARPPALCRPFGGPSGEPATEEGGRAITEWPLMQLLLLRLLADWIIIIMLLLLYSLQGPFALRGWTTKKKENLRFCSARFDKLSGHDSHRLITILFGYGGLCVWPLWRWSRKIVEDVAGQRQSTSIDVIMLPVAVTPLPRRPLDQFELYRPQVCRSRVKRT